MYLTVHATAALLIARAVPNPIAAFLVGLASHAALDFIPHGDEQTIPTHFTGLKKLRRILGVVTIDGVILLMLAAIYFWATPGTLTATAIAALIGSLLPDALLGLGLVWEADWLKHINQWHRNVMHNTTKHNLHWTQGMLVQGLVLTALWLALM